MLEPAIFFSVVVAAVSVVIDVISSIGTSRRAEFQRLSGVFAQFGGIWNRLEVMKALATIHAMEFRDLEDHNQKYGIHSNSNVPDFMLGSPSSFLGTQVTLGLLGYRFIDDTLQFTIKLYWTKLEPIIGAGENK